MGNAQRSTKRLLLNPKKAGAIFKRMQQKIDRKVKTGKMPLPTFSFKARYEELALAGAKPATDWV